METLTLSLRIVEPMMFRGPGEFDPLAKGTYSRANTLTMPSPSTIAGTLATYCISRLNKPVPKDDDWIGRYLNVLGADVEIRGPLIFLGDKAMVEDRATNGLLDMEGVKKKSEILYALLTKKPSSIEELDEEDLAEGPSPIEMKREARVGIMLELRGSMNKIAREGFLYSAEYIDYSQLASRGPPRPKLEIAAEVSGSIAEELSSAQGAPVKLGGESRVAFLSFRMGSMIPDEAKRALGWAEMERGALALYLISPALFKGGKPIREFVMEWADGKGCEFLGMAGGSEPLGAGFELGDGRRKPIYSSLKPGSIIFLKGDLGLEGTPLGGGLGEASQLGYGSFLAIPVGAR
jgi:CRISPR-associated protein Cmr3